MARDKRRRKVIGGVPRNEIPGNILGMKFRATLFFADLLSGEAEAAETAHNRHVIAQIVPEPGVVDLVDANVVFEQADDQGNGGYPPMPDSPEEISGVLGGCGAVAGNATGGQEQERCAKQDNGASFHRFFKGQIAGWRSKKANFFDEEREGNAIGAFS